MGNESFHLDVAQFDSVIEQTQQLAKKLQTMKGELDQLKNQLLFSWVGDGRNMFESRYRQLSQQFTDIKDDLFQVAEDMLALSEEYIQADTNLAKSEDGISNRF